MRLHRLPKHFWYIGWFDVAGLSINSSLPCQAVLSSIIVVVALIGHEWDMGSFYRKGGENLTAYETQPY